MIYTIKLMQGFRNVTDDDGPHVELGQDVVVFHGGCTLDTAEAIALATWNGVLAGSPNPAKTIADTEVQVTLDFQDGEPHDVILLLGGPTTQAEAHEDAT